MYVYTCNYIVLSFDSANWNQLKLKKSLIRMVKSQWTPLFPVFFPHLRRGLLDFSRAVLLLLRLRLLHLLRLLTRRLLLAVQIPVGTAGPQPRLPGRSGHCRTSTASSRSQWALPDLNRELQIPVGTAGPQPRLPDRSGHCRTSTATSRSQWALPDLNGKNVRKDVR